MKTREIVSDSWVGVSSRWKTSIWSACTSSRRLNIWISKVDSRMRMCGNPSDGTSSVRRSRALRPYLLTISSFVSLLPGTTAPWLL
ncbi:hypothetical protein BDV26DRAFT_266311 [Aspergillus bertholletiae]|uniref:Uncharacterized protein n=1 Tax=Aspergillus bertholletiae TaxID=1226010 RepID=A0A5N7B2C7_9EURO|nr:hypothetical protein BDV26DRAFT_266311 [Aspergillus bertholletiae]